MNGTQRLFHRPIPRGVPGLPAIALLLGVALTFLPAGARADDAKAREIMERVNDRDDGDNRISDMRMVLIDKKGTERIRETRSYAKDRGDDTLSLIFFLRPADVENTGFLTYDYDESGKDDDQWLYLPALRKTKRIASDDKSGSFMGTDFNFSDLTEPDLEDYDFKLLKEEEVGGHMTWRIESVPRSEEVMDEIGYSKSVVWVRQDNHVVIRAVRWVYKSQRRKFMQITKLEQVDGVWTSLEIKMVTKEGRTVVHATILEFSNVRYNQDLSEDLFTVRRLEKGA